MPPAPLIPPVAGVLSGVARLEKGVEVAPDVWSGCFPKLNPVPVDLFPPPNNPAPVAFPVPPPNTVLGCPVLDPNSEPPCAPDVAPKPPNGLELVLGVGLNCVLEEVVASPNGFDEGVVPKRLLGAELESGPLLDGGAVPKPPKLKLGSCLFWSAILNFWARIPMQGGDRDEGEDTPKRAGQILKRNAAVGLSGRTSRCDPWSEEVRSLRARRCEVADQDCSHGTVKRRFNTYLYRDKLSLSIR
jgi:hypothetical protein